MSQIPIRCNNVPGTFYLHRMRIVCGCADCLEQGNKKEFSCTQFEQHAGSGAAKKWKASLRICPGGVPEVPAGAVC